MSQRLAITNADEAFAALKDAWLIYRTTEDYDRGIAADNSLYHAELKHLIAVSDTATMDPEAAAGCSETASHRYPSQVVNAVAHVLRDDMPSLVAAEAHAHSVLSAMHDVSRISTLEQLRQLPPKTYVKTNRGALRWAEYLDDFDLPATVLDWGAER